ncbi:MAG: hypothetical protein JJU36_01585 [Phycisphaeraceae bacterium]|nr:hypothetical protein [Phycisphaeraceae bacterium]
MEIAAWPFDGLDIHDPNYHGRHVMFEPYPTGMRSPDTPQTDENDAIASVTFFQRADQSGTLPSLLDLGALSPDDRESVQFEGWIVGYHP